MPSHTPGPSSSSASTEDATRNPCQRLQVTTGWDVETLASKLDLSKYGVQQWLDDDYTPEPSTIEQARYYRHRYDAQQQPVSDILEELKEEMLWNNGQLGDELGVSHAAISNWIRETAAPSNKNHLQITSLYADCKIDGTMREKLRYLRDDTDLSDADIADEIGASRNTVSYWMREEKEPREPEYRDSLEVLYDEYSSETTGPESG